MSEPVARVSPLASITAQAAGRAAPVVLSPRTGLNMIDLRARDQAPLREHVRTLLGADLPQANRSAAIAGGAILWLGPDQWLVVAAGPLNIPLGFTIPGGTLTDVGHGRVAVRIAGSRTSDLLPKGCMLDLHPAAFPDGACAQTAIAKIPTILHRVSGGTFDLYVPRSYARSFWRWLSGAAGEYGYHVARVP